MKTGPKQYAQPFQRYLQRAICGVILLLVCTGPARAAGIEFDRMAFFEASGDASVRSPESWDDARYRDSFDKADTRYVYTVVSLKNLRWQLEDQQVVIHLRYYYSDGRLFDDPVIDYAIPQDWEYAELWNGTGWPEPGTWEPDRYRVELWLDNRYRIGSGYFTIR